MPASSYRRRAYRRDLVKPRKFLWTAVGPVTYQKEGSLTSQGLVSGADVFEAAETGALTSQALLSGTSQAILQRSALVRYPYPVVRRRTRARML